MGLYGLRVSLSYPSARVVKPLCYQVDCNVASVDVTGIAVACQQSKLPRASPFHGIVAVAGLVYSIME